MSFCGISVTKELAVIAAVADANADGVLDVGNPVALEMFTYADGRAFRNCPYFSHWKSSGQFFTHDAGVEELDFGRAVADFRERHGCCAIGFNRDQLLLVDPSALAIPKDGPHVDAAIRQLNRHAAGAARTGYLFEPNTAAQHMWASLPLVNGLRILPTAEKVATGRYDGIRAIVNAMCTARHFSDLATGRAL